MPIHVLWGGEAGGGCLGASRSWEGRRAIAPVGPPGDHPGNIPYSPFTAQSASLFAGPWGGEGGHPAASGMAREDGLK